MKNKEDITKVSLFNFKKVCNELSLKRFVYDTSSQIKTNEYQPLNFMASFTSIFISLNPNIIVFKNNSSTLQLSGVKYIEITESKDISAVVLTVICGGAIGNFSDNCYTFVGYKKNL